MLRGAHWRGDRYVTFHIADTSQLCVQTLYGRWGRLTPTGTLAGIKVQYWKPGEGLASLDAP